MPLSAGLLRSQRNNVTPQCPPRIQVQYLNPVSWIRVPNQALTVMVDQPDDCHGWRIQCSEALQVMTLQIPNEDRYCPPIILLTLFDFQQSVLNILPGHLCEGDYSSAVMPLNLIIMFVNDAILLICLEPSFGIKGQASQLVNCPTKHL